MAEPWIRVHAQLRRKPVVARAAVSLNLDPQKAMGMLVEFWGNVAAHADNGSIVGIPDPLLEEWAGWRGKRGAFAKWLREHHLDAEGRVSEWDDYAGALEQRRAKERQRLHDKRNLLRNTVRTVAQQNADVAQPLQDVATRARERNGTERNGTEVQEQKQGARKRAAVPDWVGECVAQWAEKVGHIKASRVHVALGPAVTTHGWDSVAKGLADYLVATPGGRTRIEWFAERATYWVELAKQPMTDPQTCQPTARFRVVVEGKAA